MNIDISEGDLHKYHTEIPSAIDDMGLSVYAFRLYVHFMRAAKGTNSFSSSLNAMAGRCQMSVGKIMDARHELVEAGLLTCALGMSPADAVVFIKMKSPQKMEGFTNAKACSWCKGQTLVLESHHYPISKDKGGNATVDICANCHREYHALVECRYTLTPLAIGKGGDS